MHQLQKTKNRCLSQAKKAEEEAALLMDSVAQDKLLDKTVWLRVMASLPSYNRH